VADEPTIAFPTVVEATSWFESNHTTASGFWLKIAKGAHAGTTVNYDQVLDIALCFGWIDGQKKPLDDEFWLQRFSPRKARSRWSKRNRGKAEALIEAGQMRPAGVREVEAARADGRWDAAYEGQKSATVPDDLRFALDADPEASAFFETLNGVNRFAILYRIGDAKKPETRAARIAKFVTMCHNHETIHPQKS
jgi:uncharacterized protein YdeI (YjbR/CyaY-like superfamily)